MTTSLVPMAEAAFAAFAERAIADYAQDNTQSGRWRAHEAFDRARVEFERLLPQGRDTPNHFLYEIHDSADGQAVGALWFSIDSDPGGGAGYLYNIRVEPAFRGRGHAKAALDRLDEVAVGMGLHSMALHVFGHNTTAQALYRASGYWITGMNMRKPLRRPVED
jgi:ribosomal protein S18 acetylase RimI-like enzyme